MAIILTRMAAELQLALQSGHTLESLPSNERHPEPPDDKHGPQYTRSLTYGAVFS